jgi:hypothetical protein
VAGTEILALSYSKTIFYVLAGCAAFIFRVTEYASGGCFAFMMVKDLFVPMKVL